MALRFKNNKLVIINYGDEVTSNDIDTIKKNYPVDEIDEIRFMCKGFEQSRKPWYLQCVDWMKLIPEAVLNNQTFALRLPEDMPNETTIYMVAETFSRSGRLPKIMEYHDGKFNRIVDLEYEVNFSRNKRKEMLDKKQDQSSHPREQRSIDPRDYV